LEVPKQESVDPKKLSASLSKEIESSAPASSTGANGPTASAKKAAPRKPRTEKRKDQEGFENNPPSQVVSATLQKSSPFFPVVSTAVTGDQSMPQLIPSSTAGPPSSIKPQGEANPSNNPGVLAAFNRDTVLFNSAQVPLHSELTQTDYRTSVPPIQNGDDLTAKTRTSTNVRTVPHEDSADR